MVPPELGATDDLEKSKISPKSGLWKRRSGLEKLLLVLLGVCGTAIVVSGSYYAINVHNNSISDDDEKPPSPYQDGDVCLTAECAIAAGNILTTMDQTADPCQNFFQYACGGWISSNEIPDAKSRWGKFYELRDKVDLAVRKIIEAPKDESDAKAVGYLKDHYSACVDIDTINSIGYAPFKTIAGPENGFGGWPLVQDSWDENKFNFENATGFARNLLNEAQIISTFVYLDEIDVTHNVIYIDQPSLALPRDMYIEDSYAEFVKTYKKYITDTATVMIRELGSNVADEDLKSEVENIYNFEMELAKISTPEDQRRNATELYNPFTLKELKESYDIDWQTYFNAVFTYTDDISKR